jgi:hypothetical protein
MRASSPVGDTLWFEVQCEPAKGTLTVLDPNDGTYQYTPNPDAYGSDAFTFKVWARLNALVHAANACKSLKAILYEPSRLPNRFEGSCEFQIRT